jgi:hypothetical protein
VLARIGAIAVFLCMGAAWAVAPPTRKVARPLGFFDRVRMAGEATRLNNLAFQTEHGNVDPPR